MQIAVVLIFLSHESSSPDIFITINQQTAPRHELTRSQMIAGRESQCRESFTRPFSSFNIHGAPLIGKHMISISSCSLVFEFDRKKRSLAHRKLWKVFDLDFPSRLASDFRSTVLGQRVKAANGFRITWEREFTSNRFFLEFSSPAAVYCLVLLGHTVMFLV